MAENPGAIRRRRFIDRGYQQAEIYLPRADHDRVKIAAQLVDGMHQYNDVIEVAVREWLDRNQIPHRR